MNRLLSFSLVLAFVLTAQAQNVLFNPQTIIVNPKPSFEVEVFVDKDLSGLHKPKYYIGENISIGVRVSEASYVYLFDVRPNGEIHQILPNHLDIQGKNNYLFAGETKYFPPKNANYTFMIDGPRGLEKVIAVASKQPLDTRSLARFESGEFFASSRSDEKNFAQTLSIVVNPLPQNEWVTDTAAFRVRW